MHTSNVTKCACITKYHCALVRHLLSFTIAIACAIKLLAIFGDARDIFDIQNDCELIFHPILFIHI